MDEVKVIEPTLTELKVIPTDLGAIKHGMKASEVSFKGFGEAYFSEVHKNSIKGWKLHKEMTLNVVVPVGSIKFVVYNEERNSFFETIIGEGNHQRLTVPPGLWMAFQGIGSDYNLLLNIASIEHDPNEAINKNLEEIKYDW